MDVAIKQQMIKVAVTAYREGIVTGLEKGGNLVKEDMLDPLKEEGDDQAYRDLSLPTELPVILLPDTEFDKAATCRHRAPSQHYYRFVAASPNDLADAIPSIVPLVVKHVRRSLSREMVRMPACNGALVKLGSISVFQRDGDALGFQVTYSTLITTGAN